jgi:hypothetical protein
MQERAKDHAHSLNGQILEILSREASLEARRLEMRSNFSRFVERVDQIARKHPTKLNSVELIREDRDTR